MRTIPDIAVDFVRAHEGCKLTAYEDAGGVQTIGVGHCGPEVKPGLTITARQADLYLKEDLAIAAKRLSRVLDEAVILRLTEHQYAALLSFVFNVGCRPQWTIWKLMNAGQLAQVPAQLARFVYANGQVVNGLVNRRAAEVQLWATPDPASPPAPSSAATRNAVGPAPEGFFTRMARLFG